MTPSVRAFAGDSETYLIAQGRLAPRSVCWTFRHEAALAPYILNGATGGAEVLRRLDDGWTFVGANAPYDLAVAAQNAPDRLAAMRTIFKAYDEGRVIDVQTWEMLRKIKLGRFKYDPTIAKVPGYSLADLAREWLGESLSGKAKNDDGEEPWRFRFDELIDVPIDEWPEEPRRYALADADTTWRVYLRQQADDPDLADVAAQCRAAWALHLSGAWGVRTDGDAVARLKAAVSASIDALAADLRAAGLVRKDGSRDMKAIKARVVAAYGDACPLTDGGAPSTAGETLKESGDPLLVKLADFADDQKMLGTFVPVLEGGTRLPINPRYYVLVESGRTSCRDPNLQQQPRKGGVRECYVPRPGWAYVSCDYETAELRSLAQVLTDMLRDRETLAAFGHADAPLTSAMADALLAGRDLHVETAAEILGLTYEDAWARYKAGDKDVAEARQLAKAANFGFPGGLGAETFVAYAKDSYDLVIDLETARELRDAWFRRFPEMRVYFAIIGALCHEGGGSFDLTHPRSGRVSGGCSFTAGANRFFQGKTADYAKASLYRASRECYADPSSPLYGCRLPLFIHDEIIAEVPIDRIHEAGERLAAIMSSTAREFTPDIPAPVEPAAMLRWYKGAKTVRDADGRLMLYQPELKKAA